MPKENSETVTGCISCTRRQFVAESLLASVAALLLVNCGDGVIGSGGDGITGPVNVSIKLSDYPALATVGGIVRVSGVSTPIAVVRSSSATYLAFSMVCPHAGTTINISGGAFICPNHGARFNSSGTWTGGQPTDNLTRISTTLDATGTTLALGSAA